MLHFRMEHNYLELYIIWRVKYLLKYLFANKIFHRAIERAHYDIMQDSYYVLYPDLYFKIAILQHFVRNKWNKIATVHRKRKLYTGNIINIIFMNADMIILTGFIHRLWWITTPQMLTSSSFERNRPIWTKLLIS